MYDWWCIEQQKVRKRTRLYRDKDSKNDNAIYIRMTNDSGENADVDAITTMMDKKCVYKIKVYAYGRTAAKSLLGENQDRLFRRCCAT